MRCFNRPPLMLVQRVAIAAFVFATVVSTVVVPVPANAQSGPSARLRDIARVQGVTSNQLIGYGLVTGLAGSGDTSSVAFTSKTVQNVLQAFGVSTTSNDVRTRNVAAVIVTALLPPFAHSGDNVDVTVSSMGDATSLQGGTLILTELRGPNNLVYATAQGAMSVGGFSVGATDAFVQKNHTSAGRIPQGAVIARDMVTNIQQDASGFSYVLTQPDFKTAARLASVLNARFGSVARALDAETVRVTLPGRYTNDPVNFLADAGDLRVSSDPIAKVVVNERTGTVVFGGDITLAPVAIAHGNLSITISTRNTVVQPAPFSNGQTAIERNTTVSTKEGGRKLIYINGAATLAQVVRALNTIGVTPRDLISIVQSLREAGSLQADVEII